jgi:hypothetical protein
VFGRGLVEQAAYVERQVPVLFSDSEGVPELVEGVLEVDQRLAEALYLLLGQVAAVDAA